MGWVNAATASSTAGVALTAGWDQNWPVRSAPEVSLTAVAIRNTP
jgi:hypothetical protein